jgi:hypothetical protein
MRKTMAALVLAGLTLGLVACSGGGSTSSMLPAAPQNQQARGGQDSGIGPTDSGIGPTDSGIGPTDSGIGPTDSGIGPSAKELLRHKLRCLVSDSSSQSDEQGCGSD